MYDDQPPFGADEKCRAAHYGPHPLGHSVLGTAKSITDLPVGAMREYLKRRYSPRNIALIAAGRVDFDAPEVDDCPEGCFDVQPGARTIPDESKAVDKPEVEHPYRPVDADHYVGSGDPRPWFELLFLSFTTLSGVGLGDIVPVLPMARALIMIEEVSGVMYLALVVSRLIALAVTTRGAR